MRVTFTLFLLSYCIIGFGQIQFEKVLPKLPLSQLLADFEGVSQSSIQFSDIDGDNDQDLLITGTNNINIPISKLYINDGIGNFTLSILTNIEAVRNSSIAFFDFDGDLDNDLIITGENDLSIPISKLYENDGNGIFTEVINTIFQGVKNSSVAISDIDNDGDNDLLITGITNIDAKSTKLYTNDGTGVFIEDLSNIFVDVARGKTEFIDIDGDSDKDLLITGANFLDDPVAKLYINDGTGAFTEVINNPLEGVKDGALVSLDIDNDNDNDIILAGVNDLGTKITKLYSNDGMGNFTEVLNTPFIGVNYSSIVKLDINNDNDIDLLITGFSASTRIAKLYSNNGNGVYSEVLNPDFTPVSGGSLFAADIDSDNDTDIVLTGYTSSNSITKLYINDSYGVFEEVLNTPFEGIEYGSIAFADIDGDSDNDILLTGGQSTSSAITALYKNDGIGGYTKVLNSPFENVFLSSVAFADIDGDNDQDLLITGRNSLNVTVSNLYLNDGLGNFSLMAGTTIDAVDYSSIAFADIDNDNDLDLLITGKNLGYNEISKLYVNDGFGVFTESGTVNIEGIYNGSTTFIDVDNDNDILILGTNSAQQKITKLYLNDGSGGYDVVTNTPFVTVQANSVSHADIDGDNDIDILISGISNSNQYVTKLYLNDGQGVFTEETNTPFDAVGYGSIQFMDIDMDTDYDLLITGENASLEHVSKLYLNDGTGNYTEIIDELFVGVELSSVAFSDIDNDNDIDVLICGANTVNKNISYLYRNISCFISSSIDVINSCNSLTWIDGITYYFDNNTATYTLTNNLGCDSIITLNLTINSMTYEEQHVHVCTGESYTFPDGVVVDNINSFFNQTVILSTITNCDSVIIFYMYADSVNFYDTIQICSGENYTFPDGTTQTNITSGLDYTSNFSSATTGCDSIITTTINVTTIDNTTTLNGVTISATETNADNYVWLNCDDNYNSLLPFPLPVSSLEFNTPGNYAIEIAKDGCVDTSNCIAITNQDFYDLPNYTPLSAEVYAFPVTDLDSCNGLALGFGNGGFPPYQFDWFTQTNNDYLPELDSLCEGFHTLKIYDMIGDSASVDYFVTDSANWYNWYQSNATYVDTIYLDAPNCVIDMNLPIDSTSISAFYYLYSGAGLNEDYYYLEISYYQTGTQYTYGDTVLMELNGIYLIDFSIVCPNKSTSRIKTILTTLDYPNILGLKVTKENSFKIYPNPTQSHITIDLGQSQTNSQVQITDFSGKIIYKQANINQKMIKVDLKQFSAGIYFVKIENSLGKNVMKLIKQ